MGAGPAPAGAPAYWASHVVVEDLAQARTRAQRLGGSVLVVGGSNELALKAALGPHYLPIEREVASYAMPEALQALRAARAALNRLPVSPR